MISIAPLQSLPSKLLVLHFCALNIFFPTQSAKILLQHGSCQDFSVTEFGNRRALIVKIYSLYHIFDFQFGLYPI